MVPPAARSPGDDSFRPIDSRIGEALRFMEANLGRALSAASIAAHVGRSRCHFSSLFRREVGLGVAQMFLRMRLERAAELLTAIPRLPLKDVSGRVGMGRHDVFARAFRDRYGVTPNEFRNVREASAGRRQGFGS